MKRIHILLMALVALSIQGCQDDFDVPSEQASRSYEQDAEVLNRFVDINKTTHEYYINPNKRTTVFVLYHQCRCGRVGCRQFVES